MKNSIRRIYSSIIRIVIFISIAISIIGICSSSVLSQSKPKNTSSEVSRSILAEENHIEVQSFVHSQTEPPRSVSSTPISGDHFVGSGQEFTKLIDAISALKLNGISGQVRLLLTDSVYIEPPIIIDGIAGAGGFNTITIQPSLGVNSCVVSVGIDNTENGCLVIKQISNVVINGMNANGTSLNALTIKYDENQSEPVNQYAGAIRIISSSNIQILNTKILGRFNPARTKGYDAISTLSSVGTGSCNSINIQYCIITRGRYGINQNGASSSQPDKYWFVSMNKFGGGFADIASSILMFDIRDSLSSGGILLNRIDSSSIESNLIDGVRMPAQIIFSTIDNRIAGITTLSTTNTTLRANTINNVVWDRTDGSTASSSGIRVTGNLSLASPGNNLLANNSISSVNSHKDLSSNPKSAVLVSGIHLTLDRQPKIYYNSVWLSQASSNSGINTCLYVQGDSMLSSEANVRNNAFMNSSTNGNGLVTVLFSDKRCSDFSYEDHNVLYSPNGSIYQGIPNIEGWNSQCGLSQTSVSGDPGFISPTDLHLANFGTSYANNLGVQITEVANDRDGEMRNGMSPDAGCDENVTLQSFSDIQLFNISAGYLYGSPEGQPLNLTVRGKNNGSSTENIVLLVSVLNENGTAIYYGTVTLTAPPFDFFSATVPAPWAPPTLSSLELYTIQAVSQHATDSYPANDSSFKSHRVFPIFDGNNYSSTFETNTETEGWLGTGDWELGNPQKLGGTHSGTKAWTTKLTDEYSPKKHSFLFSPYFDVSNNFFPKIQFAHSIRTEPSWDGSVFQFTTNMGATWENMENLSAPYSGYWYDESVYQNSGGSQNCFDQTAAVAPDGSMFPQGPKWTSNGDCLGNDIAEGPFGYFTSFRQTQEVAGKPLVQFRYWTYSDVMSVDSGWAFDDFSLKVDSGGSISGYKFEDINKNGTRDASEPGIAGWTINLQGPASLTTQTDANGNYLFQHLPEGIYIVTESLKTGWIKTYPTFEFYNISIHPGSLTNENINFGNFELGKIRIDLAIDIDGDGTVDSVDNAPLPAGELATFVLRQDTTIISEFVHGDGLLSYPVVLDAGTYEVEQISSTSGWMITSFDTFTFTISESGFEDSIRFLNFKKISLSGKKFNDLNINSNFDTNEPGLSGWVITLNNGTSVTTDSTGYFEFRNIGPGSHSLIETNQAGWTQTFPGSSNYSFTALSGNNITGINFGNYNFGNISGIKFYDANNNGARDTNETGLSNWKIVLKGTVNETTFTSSDGYYEFNNLPAGAYRIHEVYQAGWQQTYPANLRYFDTIKTSGQRITNQDFGNYKLPNSLSGMKFFDINANGVKDSLEPGLENWKIKLFDSSRSTVMVDTTDSLGNYSFQNLPDGVYIIKEVLKDEWVQTYPRSVDVATGYQPGIYILKLSQGISKTGLDFGNTIACRYIGQVGGSWQDPANWSCGHPPDAGTPIIIPRDTSVVIDSLPSDSIHSVRIQQGGRIHFGLLNMFLRIQGRLQIDSGGTLSFDGGTMSSLTNAQSGLVLYGDWINYGIFAPGQSTIVFKGDSAKSIVAGDIVNESETITLPGKERTPNDYTSNSFYNLVIDGENTNLIGNMRIQNSLALYRSLNTRAEDTITIENPSPDAIDSTGILPRGSIRRVINTISGGTYRFESTSSSLSFNAGEELPDTVLITTLPDTTTDVFDFHWKVVGGVLDTISNTVTVDSIGKFSKWVLGKPGTGYNKATNTSINYGSPTVSRMYTITNSGGGNFNATLQLRYDDDELFEGQSQSDLRLLQGPIVADTMHQNWNMISIPVLPETTYEVAALFPSANSNAFKFNQNSGYLQQSSLDIGSGYWLKFPATEFVGILGEEQRTLTVDVESGWNLVGTISFPIAASSVTDTTGAEISGVFFGYRNGYFVSDTLRALHAYWIKVNNAGSLTFQQSSQGTAKTSSAYRILKSLGEMLVSDANGNNQSLYFGSSNEITESTFEMPPLSPSGIFDARFAHNSIAAIRHKEIVREIPIQITSAKYPLTISWETLEHSSISADLVIDKRSIPLLGKGQTTVLTPTSYVGLRLLPSRDVSIPMKFALYQNYPNPFNPSTTIRYDIPTDGFVTLKVFNVLGQLVATLIENKQQQAGKYSELFNNEVLSSGVYFYSITVTDASTSNHKVMYQTQRKMLLMK
ncbi:MAG: T9SS type A sorting domain-containing protein [Ignavibacteriae bacterium]|nr:T9SS type A sorting domain-containing protein [Ignavibacteriota bacterium]